MAVVFSEGFETGPDGASITTSNTGYTTVNGTRIFDSTTRIAGSLSAKCIGNGTTGSFLRHTFTGTTLRYFRRYMNVDAFPASGNTVTLCRVRTSGGTDVAQIVLISTGVLQIRNGATIVATTSTTLTLRSWFRVEWQLDNGTSTQNFRLFTGANANGTTATETLTGAFTGGTFDRCEEGGATNSYVGNIWIDEVVDDDATWPGPSASATAIPVADAGSDQAVATSASVQLDGTASADSDGSISAYEWRQVSGTSVTLSSTTASQPTFTAPGSAATLVFGLIVTDNFGVRSPEDTITVTVSAPATAYTEDFSGGTNGTSITTGNTGYTTITGTAVFDASTRINGALSGKMTSSGSGALLRHTFTATTSRYFRRYLRVSAFPVSGSVLAICRLRNSSSSTMAEINLTNDGVFTLKNGSTVVATSSNTPLTHTWFRLEWFINGGGTTQTLRLFLHGDVNSATPTETLTGAYSGGTFDRCEEGAATNSFMGTVWVDAVADDTGAWPGPASDANQLPVASAGSDQQTLPFQTVTLNGSGSSDAEGGLTYSWEQLSGQAVTLSSAVAAQPTFTAPALELGAALTFKLTVTDSGNHTASDIVTVLVSPTTDFMLQGGDWVAYETKALQSGTWN